VRRAGAGLTPVEQTIAVGANVLATLPGTTDRWVMVAAVSFAKTPSGGQVVDRSSSDHAAGDYERP
jgi:hypothetical protein